MNRSRSAEIVMSGDHRDRAEKWASSSVVKGGPVGARTPTLSGRGTMQRLLIKKGVCGSWVWAWDRGRAQASHEGVWSFTLA